MGLAAVRGRQAYEVDPEWVQRNWTEASRIGFVTGKDLRPVSTNPRGGGRGRVGLMGYSFTFDDVFPLIGEIFARRGYQKKVQRAVGVGFKYYDQSRQATPLQLPRQIHYAADYVLHDLAAVPRELWEKGFQDSVGDCFGHIVDASRAADDPARSAEALLAWSRVGAVPQYSIARWVGPRVGQLASDLTGEQFRQTCAGIIPT
jgi:hypothetical protein